MNNEPRSGSFSKQRISLSKQIANAACVLGTVIDIWRDFYLQSFSEHVFAADVRSAYVFLYLFGFSVTQSVIFIVELFLCCLISSFELLSMPGFL